MGEHRTELTHHLNRPNDPNGSFDSRATIRRSKEHKDEHEFAFGIIIYMADILV